MTQLDLQGNHLTGASAAAASAYGDALRQLSIYAGDPLAVADRLVEDEPGFGMAHVLKAWLFLLGTDAKAAAAPTVPEGMQRASAGGTATAGAADAAGAKDVAKPEAK